MIDLVDGLQNIVIVIVVLLLGEIILKALGWVFGLYTVVEERECKVYVLFGKVLGALDEPGLHILPLKLGPAAFIVNWLGKCYTLDMRLDPKSLIK